MIRIDDRGHQPPLLPFFSPYDVEVLPEILDASDIEFCGLGPEGEAMVGAERKKIKDLVESLRSERLAGFQLAGLLEYQFPMLVVEGIWRPGEDGVLEVLSGGGFKTMRGYRDRPMMYREIANLLLSVQLVWGVTVIRTASPQETAAAMVGMYKWFQKDWAEHQSHKAIYAPPPQQDGNGRARMRVRKASLATKIIAQFPGVDRKAWEVGEYFKEDKDLLMAAIVGRDWEEMRLALGIKEKKSKTVKGIFEAK